MDGKQRSGITPGVRLQKAHFSVEGAIRTRDMKDGDDQRDPLDLQVLSEGSD